jgi:filamentous hemagglutinin family protein
MSFENLGLSRLCAALMAAGLVSSGVLAAPQDPSVVAGSAKVLTGKDASTGGPLTYIDQSSERAVIDWRSFSIGAPERVHFNQPGVNSSTLNRVTGDQLSSILGTLTAKGQVILVNPNGIVFGAGSRVDVGSLIASTANISNDNFMAGKLAFDQPGKAGAGILQGGTITANAAAAGCAAAECGLVALVAPHVRNDGLIQARLGKVVLASGNTFSIDLFGDQLVSLAVSDTQLAQLLDAQGRSVRALIDQAGTIDVAGGKAVLVTAVTAKSVLDSVVNMSGTMVADTVANRQGQILLLGKGGKVEVSGQLGARGLQAGEAGGKVQVLGDQVSLTDNALVDASGQAGGGSVLVGGDSKQSSAAYQAQRTDVGNNVQINVSATGSGEGGEAIVWSKDSTAFRGTILARAPQEAGGNMMVGTSGALDFQGAADASGRSGAAGSLRLSAAQLTIASLAADGISRTLGTGTNVALDSASDVLINAVIDGRGGQEGGALTVNARGSADRGGVTFTEDIYTNNGAVSMTSENGLILADRVRRAGAAESRFDPLIATGNGTIDLNGTGLDLFRLVSSGTVNLTAKSGKVWLHAVLGEIEGPLGSLKIDQRSALATDDVRLAGARVAQGGRVQIDGTGNIRIFEGGLMLGGISAFSEPSRIPAGAVVLHSTKFDPRNSNAQQNLFNHPDYRVFPGKNYLGLKSAGLDRSNLNNYRVGDGQSGLTPPGPLSALPRGGAPAGLEPGRAFGEIRPFDTLAEAQRPATPEPASQMFTQAADPVPQALAQAPDPVPQVLASVDSNLVRGATDMGNGARGLTLSSGGRGLAQRADLGRSASANAPSDVFDDNMHVVEGPVCDAGGGVHAYFGRDAFGAAIGVACE